ncbi:hypothetical protein I4641_10070 [Waterburya agarophytonicola K14]|uniref:Cell division protein FtsL n=1 Tax=Waterburya agarophytonicola KI4 TaxID=2874699 RepID=A0A964BR93_9CYAN|nr:hypothetical protein [Waterburya agarophytonicola]MCC0177322.1 hypothetical protein [Waterburya agarophytonicola KI4]
MSALRKPDLETQYYSPQTQFKPQKKYHRQLTNLPQKQVRKVVKSRNFPQQSKLPQKLRLLSLLQKGSFGLALVSMAASIGLYASTVKIPELWSQEYRNLEDLQSQERELIAINEKIKYQIAHDASEDNRLSISKPESAVFIPPAKVNLKSGLKTISHNQEVAEIPYNNLGY